MSEDEIDRSPDASAEVEQEVRRSRQFSEKEVLAKLAGPGAMKGASPVSPVEQAQAEIDTFLSSALSDPAGVLRVVLQRDLKGSELVLYNLDQPLVSLSEHLRRILASHHRMQEIVREADIEWGRRMDERPFFDREDVPANPDDPYTLLSIRTLLEEVLERLAS